jgi:acetyl-CoA carboxylase biotin carboxyl carrier protein
MDPLTNEDVADILALLDSLPYDEFDLETPRFRLTLRRTPGGWTQSTEVHAAPEGVALGGAAPGGAALGGPALGVKGPLPPSIGGDGALTPVDAGGSGTEDASVVSGAQGGAGVGGAEVGETDGAAGDGGHEDAGLVAVRAPLPGTFYRAPRPGAAAFAEVGSRVGADTVIGIVETMKLMNSVSAGVAGVVAEFCVANAELVAQGAALLRIRTAE